MCAIRELASPNENNRDSPMEVFKAISGCAVDASEMMLTICLHLASESFLSKLLAYRREFLYVPALSASVEGTFVSCIDVILANIAEASAYIATDASDIDGMKGSLSRQKEYELIRAASQLPYNWAEMLDLLTSDTAPCMVLRLITRLAFAAYILHPQLSGRTPRVDASVLNV
ncbi:hypothetical protein B0F90DRAFT_62645 [Multifurca ochricompacta]|uniref:Uncharacterized protein n=1 Tax=Multifurca ochricompacta TaxID=376703 RepID=A0AAD4MD08_9AGAM|nr:hypothetical protein B0F90DRAFT_62645 [Multifurca ochricompacta]